MTALSENFYLMSIHNIFSWLILTLLLLSQIGKPILDSGEVISDLPLMILFDGGHRVASCCIPYQN